MGNVKMKKGVTLIELSVVLIIIGLLLGVAFKGFELISTSTVSSEAAKIQKITTAIATFKSAHGRLPGDGCTAVSTTALCSGSANGKIISTDDASEPAMFWNELYISGNLTAADRVSAIGAKDYELDDDGTTIPTSAHKGIFLILNDVQESTLCELDQKYGDGIAASSKVDSLFISTGTYTATTDCKGLSTVVDGYFLVYKN